MKIRHFLVVLLASLLPGTLLAQTAPDSLVRYQQVIPVTGLTADELYARAQEWVALTFEDVHQVLQLADPRRHLLLGSGYTRVTVRRPSGKEVTGKGVWFRFRIETREGRYRVELTDFAAIEEFGQAQYAGQDIAFWLASSHATRSASSRHGISLTSTQKGADAPVIRQALETLTHSLFNSLQQTLTAPPNTW